MTAPWNPAVGIDMQQMMSAAPLVKVEIPEDPMGTGHAQFAFRNNNPGNLQYREQPNSVPGYGGFALFPTPEDGWHALIRQVKKDQRSGLPLGAFIAKFAPPHENNTALYIRQTVKRFGASADTPLTSFDPVELAMWLAEKESDTKIKPVKLAAPWIK
jgi:hypothetical protein